MTINTFIFILVALCAVSTVLTEAIKKFCENANLNPSANLISLIDSVIVGVAGTSCAYMYLGIPFTTENCVTIAVMSVSVWIGSMIGYDKITQLVEQIVGKK